MKDTPKAPAKDTPEPSAMDRMREFTRRIVAVPKSELHSKPQNETTKKKVRKPA